MCPDAEERLDVCRLANVYMQPDLHRPTDLPNHLATQPTYLPTHAVFSFLMIGFAGLEKVDRYPLTALSFLSIIVSQFLIIVFVIDVDKRGLCIRQTSVMLSMPCRNAGSGINTRQGPEGKLVTATGTFIHVLT